MYKMLSLAPTSSKGTRLIATYLEAGRDTFHFSLGPRCRAYIVPCQPDFDDGEFHIWGIMLAGEDMTAAMSAGAATVTGGMAKASTALFAGIASLKVQAVRAGNSISIRRVDAEENQGPSHPLQDPI